MKSVTSFRIQGLALAAVIFAIDQFVKHMLTIPVQLPSRGVIEITPFFDLRWTENRGVSMGFLTANSLEMQLILVALTGLIALVVLIWMFRERLKGDILALAMVLGGALGNITDRFRFGFVVDYADLHFGDWRPFLIFNIADAAITLGVLLLLARVVLMSKKGDKSDDANKGTRPEKI